MGLGQPFADMCNGKGSAPRIRKSLHPRKELPAVDANLRTNDALSRAIGLSSFSNALDRFRSGKNHRTGLICTTRTSSERHKRKDAGTPSALRRMYIDERRNHHRFSRSG